MGRVRRVVTRAPLEGLSAEELHAFIDRLQLALARTTDELARTYFLGAPVPTSQVVSEQRSAAGTQAQSSVLT